MVPPAGAVRPGVSALAVKGGVGELAVGWCNEIFFDEIALDAQVPGPWRGTETVLERPRSEWCMLRHRSLAEMVSRNYSMSEESI